MWRIMYNRSKYAQPAITTSRAWARGRLQLAASTISTAFKVSSMHVYTLYAVSKVLAAPMTPPPLVQPALPYVSPVGSLQLSQVSRKVLIKDSAEHRG